MSADQAGITGKLAMIRAPRSDRILIGILHGE
jgi:hypothetical protein